MISKEIDLGKVSVVGKKEFDNGYSYEPLDIVHVDGQSYLSLHDLNVNNDPESDTEEKHWMLLAKRGESWYQMCVRTGRFAGTETEFLDDKQSQIDNATQAATTANEAADLANSQAYNAQHQADRAKSIAEITEALYALVEQENSSWLIKEQERQDAEVDRILTEEERNTAESTRMANENARISNETNRTSSEDGRKINEFTRQSNEDQRGIAETNRANAEAIRVNNENTRKSNESTREINENDRQSNETRRSSNENIRVLNENARISSESIREENENTRIANENSRQTQFVASKQACDTATTNAQTTANYAQEVGDHQPIIGENDNWMKWDTSSKTYKDTGVLARAKRYNLTPSIRHNKLYLSTEEIYV